MGIYTRSGLSTTKRSAQTRTKISDTYAEAALGDAFCARDRRLAREPDCQDHPPSAAAGVMSAPVLNGFDPAEFPILSLHWFGILPRPQANDRQAAPVGPIAAGIVADLAFQRDIERLHELGPRPQYELLREVERRYGCARFIRERVKRYADLDPEIVAALGGDVFPPAPIREVG